MALGTVTRVAIDPHSSQAIPVSIGDLKMSVTKVVGEASYTTGGPVITAKKLGFDNAVVAGYASQIASTGSAATSAFMMVLVQAGGGSASWSVSRPLACRSAAVRTCPVTRGRSSRSGIRMRIQPASFDQIRMASDGRLVTITADIGGVAADLKRLDECLRLRYSEYADCWIVYRVHRRGESCRDDDPERTEELVLTAQECDQRIIKRLEFIDPHGRSGYDYAREVERAGREAKESERRSFRERVSESAEQVAHEIRKAEGEPYRGRVFVPREV